MQTAFPVVVDDTLIYVGLEKRAADADPGTPSSRPPLNPADYTGDKLQLGPDLDLEAEQFTLLDGRRLTPELAEQLASEGLAEARRRNLIPGRKSLAGDGSHSPRVQFRVPESLRAAAEAKAAAEGVTLSVLAREALEHYLAS